MKKYFALFFILLAMSCQFGVETSSENGFKFETPILETDILTPEILWTFGRLGSPAVSPDRENVAYTITYYNIEENKPCRDIYVVPTNGGDSKKITDTSENEFNVAWRPDGLKIGYLSSRSGSTQIWEINPDGTGAKQVSDIEGGISGFKYSPSMDRIMFVKTVKLDDDIHDLYPDLPKANARIENDIMYRHWDTWHDYSYNHIFIADYSSEEGIISQGVDIMMGERYDSPNNPFGGIEQIDWHPNGTEIAYTCKKKTGKEYSISTNTDIYIYNIKSGETINFTEGMSGYDINPVYSPDGSYIAWKSMERDGYESDKNNLLIHNFEKNERKNLTINTDHIVSALKWDSQTGGKIFFISNDKGTDEIYIADVENKEIQRITEGIHNFQSVERGAEKLIAMKVSMSHPAELYKVDISTGEDEQLTHINDDIMDQLTMGEVEERWIKTSDGKEMHSWVIYPPHFDSTKTYPALLYNQGGPQETVSQFWSYRWNFQMMAANGYIVVAPNRRGVPGFGMEWLEQISKDYGGQNIKDLLSAIDEIAKEPYVDENRLGAVGASYGGFSVNFLAGNHNGRFKAFISHDGIFNFEQMYVTTEEMWFENWDIGGPFWDKENAAAQRSYTFSPHKYIQNWDTPILIIHGGKDYRIPEEQGMAAFNAAILKDLPARFLYFPGENHWVLEPQNGILWQRVFFEWLDKWLK